MKAYLKRKLRTENAPQAIRLAIPPARLLAAGRPDLAIDLAEGLPGELRKSNNRNSGIWRTWWTGSSAPLPHRRLIRPEALTSRRLPKGRLTPLDFQAKANRKTQDLSPSSGFEGNGLAELGLGDKTLDGVRFRIAAKLIQLAGGQEFAVPKTVEGIPVHCAVQRLYVLHATQCSAARERWSAGTPSITRMVRWLPCRLSSDRTSAIGMTRTWITWESRYPEEGLSGLAATATAAGTAPLLRLYLGTWENRRPGKKVTHIDFSSTSGEAAPFCVAMTVEEPDAGPGRTR